MDRLKNKPLCDRTDDASGTEVLKKAQEQFQEGLAMCMVQVKGMVAN